ncbi:allantoinase AllB [Dactylosporangium sp. CS-033363]|uniref:allantoinase AllB n=1 Tax=Dactylosporangium sp. CS-033363 TaxID=3239935 RepID=UPI003D8DB1E9
MTFSLRSRQVYLPGGPRAATVTVDSGQIVAVGDYESTVDGPVTDLGALALLPGLVDTHVHVNEPGRTEWEGFETATRAAAAGGVTTIVDMPLNSLPPTTSVAALREKQAAARGKCFVDVGFWGGAVPGNARDLFPLHEAGVFGFKSFLVDSGVPEFPPLDRAGLAAAFASVDALFIVHAEDPARLHDARPSRAYADFLASRPAAAEVSAVDTALSVAADTNRRVHILHLSAADALTSLRRARTAGVRVTAETCPHYLTLEAGAVPDGATEYKCCPPIRDAGNQDRLWGGLADGTISIVVSDHSPSTPALKARGTGDFASAWGGIASLQIGLPAVWTEAQERGFTLADVVRWMSSGPADLVGLRNKGRIAPGTDADLVAFDPTATFVVDPAALLHRHPVTPYAARELSGVVRTTWLRGEPVGSTPRGRFLRRGDAQ